MIKEISFIKIFLFLSVIAVFIYILNSVSQPVVRTTTPVSPTPFPLAPTQSPNTLYNPSVNPTTVPADIQNQIQQEQQSQADKAYGSVIQSYITTHPWYHSLPLITNDYFVYFDVGQNIFVAYIYPSDSLSSDAIKQEVTSVLTNLSSDTGNYQIQWHLSSH